MGGEVDQKAFRNLASVLHPASGAELDAIHLHLAVDRCLAAFERIYPGKADAVEVTEFFGRDETPA